MADPVHLRVGVLLGLFVLAACPGCGVGGSSARQGATTAGTPNTTGPLAVVTAVTAPTTVVASAGRTPQPDATMVPATTYTVVGVAGSTANLTFTTPSQAVYPVQNPHFFGIERDLQATDPLVDFYPLDATAMFFKDPSTDPNQIVNETELRAAVDPVEGDVLERFASVPGMTITKVPSPQKVAGLDAEVVDYRVDANPPKTAPCIPGGTRRCLMTLSAPGLAMGNAAGEEGRLAVVTAGGIKLLIHIVNSPEADQIVPTIRLITP